MKIVLGLVALLVADSLFPMTISLAVPPADPAIHGCAILSAAMTCKEEYSVHAPGMPTVDTECPLPGGGCGFVPNQIPRIPIGIGFQCRNSTDQPHAEVTWEAQSGDPTKKLTWVKMVDPPEGVRLIVVGEMLCSKYRKCFCRELHIAIGAGSCVSNPDDPWTIGSRAFGEANESCGD